MPHPSVTIKQLPFFKRNSRGTFIFIHIPKTAGTSIASALNLPGPNEALDIKKHYRVRQIQRILPPAEWAGAFKFAFVRNPWDRVLSHYRFRKRRQMLRQAQHYQSFKDWLRHELVERKKKGNLRPQLEWLLSQNGHLDIDYIGRFEKLRDDFERLCQKLEISAKLPHLEYSPHPVDYRTFFDSEMVDIVADFYQKDIHQFEYSFE